MDSKQFIEELLVAGKKVAEKGQSIAEESLNLPTDPVQRKATVDGLKKGALVTGVLALLFGTKSGRALTGTAIKLGGVAALGTVAYKAYKNWKGDGLDGNSVTDLRGQAAQKRSLLILKAMIAAASADGHINNAEKAELKSHIAAMDLSEELLDDIKKMIEKPSSWQEIVDLVSSEAEASEVYLATRLFIHEHSSQQEQDFLNNLIAGLELDSDLIDELDKQLES